MYIDVYSAAPRSDDLHLRLPPLVPAPQVAQEAREVQGGQQRDLHLPLPDSLIDVAAVGEHDLQCLLDLIGTE